MAMEHKMHRSLAALRAKLGRVQVRTIPTLLVLAITILAIPFLPQQPGPAHLLQSSAAVGDVFPWSEGYTQRTAQLVRFDHTGDRPIPVFYDPKTRLEMTLPGTLTLIANPGVNHQTVAAIVDELPHTTGLEPIVPVTDTYLVHTTPGIPALHTARALLNNPQIDAAIPNWNAQTYRFHQEADTPPTDTPDSPTEAEDDHSDTIDGATQLSLTQQITANLDIGDVDYFTVTVPEGQPSYYAFRISPYETTYIEMRNFHMNLQDEDGNCAHRPCGPEIGLTRSYVLQPRDILREGFCQLRDRRANPVPHPCRPVPQNIRTAGALQNHRHQVQRPALRMSVAPQKHHRERTPTHRS